MTKALGLYHSHKDSYTCTQYKIGEQIHSFKTSVMSVEHNASICLNMKKLKYRYNIKSHPNPTLSHHLQIKVDHWKTIFLNLPFEIIFSTYNNPTQQIKNHSSRLYRIPMEETLGLVGCSEQGEMWANSVTILISLLSIGYPSKCLRCFLDLYLI